MARPSFRRLAHLEPQPLLGGDLASRYPLRVAAGILHKAGVPVEVWLARNSCHLPHGQLEANLVAEQLRLGKGSMETTSCGRVLDAVAAVLGICFERSYEGEPAMKLESAALWGRDLFNIKPLVTSDVLDTAELLKEIYTNLGRVPVADLAYCAHKYLAEGLAELATQKATELGTLMWVSPEAPHATNCSRRSCAEPSRTLGSNFMCMSWCLQAMAEFRLVKQLLHHFPSFRPICFYRPATHLFCI